MAAGLGEGFACRGGHACPSASHVFRRRRGRCEEAGRRKEEEGQKDHVDEYECAEGSVVSIVSITESLGAKGSNEDVKIGSRLGRHSSSAMQVLCPPPRVACPRSNKRRTQLCHPSESAVSSRPSARRSRRVHGPALDYQARVQHDRDHACRPGSCLVPVP